MKAMKRFVGLVLLLMCSFVKSADGSSLAEQISEYKETNRHQLFTIARELQDQFGTLTAGSGSDAAYFTELREQAAAKVRLCNIVGKSDFSTENIDGIEVQVCTTKRTKLLVATRNVHPDKVNNIHAASDLTPQQQQIFVRALKEAYTQGVSGLLLEAGLKADDFTVATLFSPDEVSGVPEVDPGQKRIKELATYVIELFTKSFAGVEKKEDPNKPLVDFLQALRDFVGDQTPGAPVNQLLDGMRKETLTLDEVERYREVVEHIVALSREVDGFFGSMRGEKIREKVHADEAKESEINREIASIDRVQQNIENILVPLHFQKFLEFIAMYEREKRAAESDDGTAHADPTHEPTEFEKQVAVFRTMTSRLATFWNETFVLSSNTNLSSVAGLIRNTLEELITPAELVSQYTGTDPDGFKRVNKNRFENSVEQFRNIILHHALRYIQSNTALVAYKDRFMQWVHAYQQFANYVAVHIYEVAEPFVITHAGGASGGPTGPKVNHQKAQNVLVELNQVLQVLAAT